MNDNHDTELERKRRIRNSALLYGGIAALFFVGFIAISAVRG